MTPLNPAAALTALADMDVELPMNGLARDLDLELLSDVRLVQGAAAVGAGAGQRCLVDLVNLFGDRRLAVGLWAVVGAGLAAWLLGVRLGLALGERPCLALAGTKGRVELTAEPRVLGLKVVDPSLKGLAVGTTHWLHAGIIRSSRTRSWADGKGGMVQLELRALIKYLRTIVPHCGFRPRRCMAGRKPRGPRLCTTPAGPKVPSAG